MSLHHLLYTFGALLYLISLNFVVLNRSSTFFKVSYCTEALVLALTRKSPWIKGENVSCRTKQWSHILEVFYISHYIFKNKTQIITLKYCHYKDIFFHFLVSKKNVILLIQIHFKSWWVRAGMCKLHLVCSTAMLQPISVLISQETAPCPDNPTLQPHFSFSNQPVS